jgi:thiol:disulfide interchange protein DsbD
VPAAEPPVRASSDETGRIARLLSGASTWVVIASFFGFGLLLSLTPCVFPMIPILSGIIVGSGRAGKGVSHARGFILSLRLRARHGRYLRSGGRRRRFQRHAALVSLQNAWVLGGFALIFRRLALSMFGFYELQLPSASCRAGSRKRRRISKAARCRRDADGRALGADRRAVRRGAAGRRAALYRQTGDALLGGAALFFMGLGMGVPLLAVGLSAGTLLPKSGAWMEASRKPSASCCWPRRCGSSRRCFRSPCRWRVGRLLLIVPAIFMHAIDPLPPHAHGWQRFWKGARRGHAACRRGDAGRGAFRCQRSAAAAGRRSARQRQSARTRRCRSNGSVRSPNLKRASRPAGKPVMLDFYADWCVSCKEMERFTFSDARVQQKLSGWLLLQADVTANSDEDKALLTRFNLFGPPGIIFFDRVGRRTVPGCASSAFRKPTSSSSYAGGDSPL